MGETKNQSCAKTVGSILKEIINFILANEEKKEKESSPSMPAED